VLWPLALIWAYSRSVRIGSKAELAAIVQQLNKRIKALEADHARGENS